MLRLAIETVAHDYDVIVVDSAPNLGIGTINVVCAADVLINPYSGRAGPFTSALQFFRYASYMLKNVDLKGFEQMSVFCLPNTVIIMAHSPVDGRTNSGYREAWSLKKCCARNELKSVRSDPYENRFEQAIDQRSSTGARRMPSLYLGACLQ